MQSFVTVVEAGSMNAAARKLGVSGALIGQRLAALEAHLEARLLLRSTRQQSLTAFGESYYRQSLHILELVALSENQAAARQTSPQGMLRITAPTSFGNEALMPALPRFRELAPKVQLDVVLSDQNLDVIAEGVDVAFRVGALADSDLIRRRLRPYRMMLCAAPEYLATHGTPDHPDALKGHQTIAFHRSAAKPWRFQRGSEIRKWSPHAALCVNSGQAARVAARAGCGLILQPEVLVAQDVAAGVLVQVLPDWRPPEQPFSLLYHRDQHMPLRLKVFVDFACQTFA